MLIFLYLDVNFHLDPFNPSPNILIIVLDRVNVDLISSDYLSIYYYGYYYGYLWAFKVIYIILVAMYVLSTAQ